MMYFFTRKYHLPTGSIPSVRKRYYSFYEINDCIEECTFYTLAENQSKKWFLIRWLKLSTFRPMRRNPVSISCNQIKETSLLHCINNVYWLFMKIKNCNALKQINYDHLSKRSRPLTVNFMFRGILYLLCLLRNWLANKVN